MSDTDQKCSNKKQRLQETLEWTSPTDIAFRRLKIQGDVESCREPRDQPATCLTLNLDLLVLARRFGLMPDGIVP